jgi:hypothetical protein
MRAQPLVFAGITFVASNAWAQSSAVRREVDAFARYTITGQCAASLYRSEARFWRDKRPDTVPVAGLGNRAQPSTVQHVNECVSRFDVDRVPVRELLGLGFAYLHADRDADAALAFDRLVTLRERQSPDSLFWTLRQIVNVYSGVEPVRLTAALKYMARLDALGVPAATDRLLAHLALFSQAKQADSLAFMEREAIAAIAAGREIAVDSVRKQRLETIGSAHAALAYVYVRRGNYPGAITVLDSGDAELGRIKPETNIQIRFVYKALGKAAPKLKATEWVNENASKDYPANNRVSVIAFVTPTCGDACYANYATLRRTAEQFGSAVDIVLVMHTVGYYGNKLMAPDVEIAKFKKLFIEELTLPMTLAIWQGTFGQRGDGRIKVVGLTNQEAYNPIPELYNVPVFIVDKRGMLRFVTGAVPAWQTAMHNVIAGLVAE